MASPDTQTKEVWLPLAGALDRLRTRIDTPQGSHITIVQWARAGRLRTRASSAHGFFGGHIIDERDWPIPVEFWQQVGEHHDIAWQTGNLELGLEDNPGYDCRRHRNMPAPVVIDVRVNTIDLDELLDSVSQTAAPTTTANPTHATVARGGRPAAKWWSAFAEELAVYIYNKGLPEGTGSEGQSTVIQDVFSGMQAKDVAEPNRTSVQLVVNAVLKRCREAGN